MQDLTHTGSSNSSENINFSTRPKYFSAGVVAMTLCFGVVLGASEGAFAESSSWKPAQIAQASASVEMPPPPTEEELANSPISGEYGSKVTARWRKFLQRKGLSEGANPGEKFIASSSAIVDFPKGSPGWIEARLIAYEQAKLGAKSAMVRYLVGSIDGVETTIERIESAAWSNGQIQEVKELNQASRIFRKLGDFTESTIDKALQSLDPDYDFKKHGPKSLQEKKRLARASFQRRIRRSAARLVNGALPYHVIEGPSASGAAHEILVGVIWTPRLAQLAANIQNAAYGVSGSGFRNRVSEKLPKTTGEAVASLGIKVFLTPAGRRAVIAFGQAEPRLATRSGRDRAVQDALSAATTRAEAAIATFIGEKVAFTGDQTSQQLSESYADLSQGDRVTRQNVESIRANTPRVQISGMAKIGNWVVKHPTTKQDVAIVAVYWSPASSALSREMRGSMQKRRIQHLKRDAEPKQKVIRKPTAPPAGRIYEGTPSDDKAL